MRRNQASVRNLVSGVLFIRAPFGRAGSVRVQAYGEVLSAPERNVMRTFLDTELRQSRTYEPESFHPISRLVNCDSVFDGRWCPGSISI